MSSSTDNLETGSAPAEGRWSFDGEVTAAFDDMLERSIPNYRDMRKIVTDAAVLLHDRFAQVGMSYSEIVDLGASRGAALAPIVERVGPRARFRACEISPPMLEALRERFKPEIDSDRLIVTEHDLREGLPPLIRPPVSVFLSVLTLQFVPIEYRQTLLRQMHEALGSGGGLLLVEKVLGGSDEANRLLVDLYYGLKRENGYTQEAIDRKRLSLEGVLVPLPAEVNEMMLRRAGFEVVEAIWGWANFRGWLAVKR